MISDVDKRNIVMREERLVMLTEGCHGYMRRIQQVLWSFVLIVKGTIPVRSVGLGTVTVTDRSRFPWLRSDTRGARGSLPQRELSRSRIKSVIVSRSQHNSGNGTRNQRNSEKRAVESWSVAVEACQAWLGMYRGRTQL